MLKKVAIATAVLSAMLVTLPAEAATTTTTFVLTGGTLSISAPATADLGSAAITASTLTAQLGAVTVTDERGPTLGTWTATVSSTDFTTGTATAAETIGKTNLSYWSGSATSSSGTGTFVPGQAGSANAQNLSIARTAFSGSALVGNNSAAWNPTIVVNNPSGAVAGSYSGTITHSVA